MAKELGNSSNYPPTKIKRKYAEKSKVGASTWFKDEQETIN